MTAKINIGIVYDKMQDNLKLRKERYDKLEESDEIAEGDENIWDDFMNLRHSIDDICTALVFLDELLDANIVEIEFSADDYQRYLID